MGMILQGMTRCPVHPRYRARRKPTSQAEGCECHITYAQVHEHSVYCMACDGAYDYPLWNNETNRCDCICHEVI